ncbi:hypothetical protein DFH09DRAFT_1200926 [Mycena vulgaris]|nr:hypothetical protein DFH09DRAFT_1200926 [Mycena vulgaris]
MELAQGRRSARGTSDPAQLMSLGIHRRARRPWLSLILLVLLIGPLLQLFPPSTAADIHQNNFLAGPAGSRTRSCRQKLSPRSPCRIPTPLSLTPPYRSRSPLLRCTPARGSIGQPVSARRPGHSSSPVRRTERAPPTGR